RALAQGNVDRPGKLIPIEGFALSAFFDHSQFAQLDAFEGGKTGSAIGAETSATNRTAIVCRSRILHLSIIGSAKRTAHLFLRVTWSLCGERRYFLVPYLSEIRVDREAGAQLLDLCAH